MGQECTTCISELERQRGELAHDPYAPDRSPQPTPQARYNDPNRHQYFGASPNQSGLGTQQTKPEQGQPQDKPAEKTEDKREGFDIDDIMKLLRV